MSKTAIEELMQFVMEKDDDVYYGVSSDAIDFVDEHIKKFKKLMGDNELLLLEYSALMQSIEKLCCEHKK